MLRASSLGLSYPLPTIFATHSCRWLYGARKKWTLIHARKANSTSRGSSTAHSSLTVRGHLFPSRPPETYSRQSQENKEVNTRAKLGVAHAQHHQHLRVPQEEICACCVSSVIMNQKETGFSGTMGSDTTVIIEREASQDTLLSEDDGIKLPPGQQRQATHGRLERRVIKDCPPYAAGKPWSSDTIKPVKIPNETLYFLKNIHHCIEVAYEEKKSATTKTTRPLALSLTQGRSTVVAQDLKVEEPPRELASLLREHMEILGTTTSVDQAWDSYVYLIDTIASHQIVYSRLKHVPYAHLHRFSRLLARNRPKTHLQYLRLLSVMTYIVHCGGTLKIAQWNALIDHVASGRRKTKPEDVEGALSVYRGMKAGRLPGSSSFKILDDDVPAQAPMEPDVYTVTTLLAIAARAQDSSTLKSISLAMSDFGLAPNRITHLSLLRYFTDKKDLGGVRRTLQKMRHQDLELGLDGLNACIWAYGNNNRLDIVLMIYRALRHNKIPEKYIGPDDIHDTLVALKEESIFLKSGIIPNEVTYTGVIQTLAYHGHFESSIKVFIDMLSIENVEQGAPLYPSECGDHEPAPYTPSVAVYRGIFLGFSRHGIPSHLVHNPGTPDWTMNNLLDVFKRFLTLPETATLTHPVLDIIMAAFAKTSGNDRKIMRNAWEALDRRFGIVFHKSDSESRLARLQKSLFRDN